MTAAQALAVVHSLLDSMKVVMDGESSFLANFKHLIRLLTVGGEASTKSIRHTLGTYCFARIDVPALWRMLVTMQELANDINKMKRAPSRLLLVSCRVSTFPAGDQLQKDARSWVSPPDPSKNHVIARRIHYGESAVWFTRGHTFDQWNLMGGLLWIHGKRA